MIWATRELPWGPRWASRHAARGRGLRGGTGGGAGPAGVGGGRGTGSWVVGPYGTCLARDVVSDGVRQLPWKREEVILLLLSG